MKELAANAKKGLAILLAVATVLTSSGISVYAAEPGTNESSVYAEDYAESIEVGASDENRESGGAVEAEEAVSELNGAEEEDEEVTGAGSISGNQAVTGLDGVEYNTKVMKSSMNKKGWVKVSYKVKGAKYYQLDRLTADGERFQIYSGTTNKKKAFTDKMACLDETGKATYIYVMTAYDKYHMQIGNPYATVPAPLMLQGQTVEDNKAVEIMFMKLKGAVSYIIERSDGNKKDYRRVGVIHASGLTDKDVKVSSYNGDDVKNVKFEYIRYIDDTGVTYGTKYYYRVRACIEDPNRDFSTEMNEETDLRVMSLNSKALLVKSGLPQPEIVSITGPHKDGGSCYKEGTICFTPPKGVSMDDPRLKYYEIYRSTKKDTKYKRIKRVKADSLVTTALNGTVANAYVVTYTKFPPSGDDETVYYYKVRAIGQKSIKGAYSELYPHVTKFAPVTGLDVEPVNQKTLKISWDSEKCATKYEIYRSYPLNISPLNGEGITLYKKIATVANKPSSSNKITYKDSKGLNATQYYCYQIRPVNGKAKGPYSEWAAGMTQVMGPTKVTANGISPTRIDITWNASYKPSAYILERQATPLNGGAWQEIGRFKSGSAEFKNRKYSDKDSASNPIKMGITYRYRVRAMVKVNGQEKESDPAIAVVAEGYARPKAPSSFKITLLTSDGNWTGNKVSWKGITDIDHITEYVLERKTEEKGEWKAVKRFPAGSSSYSHSFYDDDDRGVHYYYRVYGVYNDGSMVVDGRSATEDILMPSKIHLESESATLNVGQTYKVKIGGFTPKETTYKDIVFTNSNTAVIKATSSGTENGYAYVVFTAKKKGTATVTVKPRYYTGKSGNLVKECKITVR